MKTFILSVTLFFALVGFAFAAEEPTVPGTYVSKKDSKEYLTLYPDGKFMLKQRATPPDPEKPFVEVTGRYFKNGENVTLTLDDGGEASGKLKGNNFEDSDGAVWAKQGSEVKELQRPKRLKIFK
ncbi:MAG: hypothetical protein ABFD97_03730 [Syntrophobacter sp.]